MLPRPKVCISIVSHHQGTLVEGLIRDLHAYCDTPIEVLLTLNIPEALPFHPEEFKFPVALIKNSTAKGFAANHNAAFLRAQTEYFCVMNPDVRLDKDPFPILMPWISKAEIGVASPLVVNPAGAIEDSARKFPTPWGILRKVVSRRLSRDYFIGETSIFPDWVAGMFMLFRTDVFRAIGGFDEGYFLYYEDVDICWRLQRQGYIAALVPATKVTHAAQRKSHRDLRYLYWHVCSIMRYFFKRGLGLFGAGTNGPQGR